MFQIFRTVLPIALVAALSACATIDSNPNIHLSAVPNEGSIHGTTDSLVPDLHLGMSTQQVNSAIGAPQSETISASEPDVICRSYVYDETITAKYAHVWFRAGQVVQASDGHQGLCVLS